jgi:hypothetical protein
MKSFELHSYTRGVGSSDRKPWAAATLAVVLSMNAASVGAQAWVPNETLVSPQNDLLDPEYNQARAQFTWNDIDGKLWLGNIDRDTGMFYPPDGKAVLVDPDAMSYDDVKKTANGPEWAWASGGDVVVYTKFTGRSHTTNNARLATARERADGTWSAGFLGPDLTRLAPYGSETARDPAPRITYVDKENNHYWREIDDPATEARLDGTPQTVGPIRHVRGARAVVYKSPVNGVDQVLYRDLDTGVIEQLTFDAGAKDQMWMWQAPEFNNEFVFMTLVDNTELRFYRKLAPPGTGTPQWTIIFSAFAARGMKINSPEPFVYKNRSYAFMAMIDRSNNFPSEIWISNMDASQPLFRLITDTTLLRARNDPEVFITSHGPRIYFNRHVLKPSENGDKYCGGPECSEGIYMSDPGLER